MRLFIFIFSLLLCACNTITSTNSNYLQAVSSWRWAKADALLKNWGRPTQVTRLPNGNRVFLYHKESYKNYPPPPVTYNYSSVSVTSNRSVVIAPAVDQQPPPNVSYLMECTTIFEVDPRNVIVDARASGNQCTGDSGFLMSRSNPEGLRSSRSP